MPTFLKLKEWERTYSTMSERLTGSGQEGCPCAHNPLARTQSHSYDNHKEALGNTASVAQKEDEHVGIGFFSTVQRGKWEIKVERGLSFHHLSNGDM